MITTKNKKLRAAIYLRVSTDDQRKGWGLKFQLEDTKRAAIERDGCSINDEHIIDDSKSGSIDNRIGWRKMMELARKGMIDVVYFWKLDRMMRDEYYFYVNEKELKDLGVELRFATQNLEDPFNRAIQVAVAADERRKILERTRRGREMAARAGRWVMGTMAYGFKLDKETKKPVKVPSEAKWVKKFFEWLVFEQCSMKEIARRANNLKVPTRSGRQWWPRTLGRILANDIYTGRTYFRKYNTKHRDLKVFSDPSKLRPKEDWILIEAPQIISRGLYEAALTQLKKNSEFAQKKSVRTYLFSRLLHCGTCGFRLKGGVL